MVSSLGGGTKSPQRKRRRRETIHMKFNCKEDIIQITPLWKGERMEDGRPKVSADVLRRLRKITLEEAWGPCDEGL